MISTEYRDAEVSVCAPATVTYTNDQCQVIELEVPEANEDTIRVSTDRDEVIVSAEGSHQQYYRRVGMRYAATLEQIQTTLRDGTLEVRVPNPQHITP